MSESLSDAVREAAMVEALTLYPLIQGWPEMNRGRRLQQKAYAKGAGVAVGRLPSRDEIAVVLRAHNFDELILGNIEWDRLHRRLCVWVAERGIQDAW